MRFFILIIIILFNFFLQGSIIPNFSILGVVPNTALLIVISIALFKGPYYGGFVGLIIGILQEIVFSPILGINAFIYFFLGYSVGLIEDKLTRDNIVIPVLLAIIATVFYNFAYYVFIYFLSYDINFSAVVQDILLVELILNGIIAIPIYKIFSKIYRAPTMSFNRRSRWDDWNY